MDKPTVGQVEDRSTVENGIELSGGSVYGLIPVGKKSRDFGGWDEVIEPGAFDNTDVSELVATVEHDPARLLGRYDTTLKIENRSQEGFSWRVELPDAPVGQDVRAGIERRDYQGGSWRMVVGKDRWDGTTRHIEEIRSLRDVTVTANPAYGYEAAPVELRSFHEAAAQNTDTPPVVEGPPAESTPENKPMQKENTSGGLLIEERSAPATENVEERIYEAMGAVPKGEARSLTHSTAAEIEPADLSTFLWDRLVAASVVLATGVPIIATDRKEVKWPTLTEDVAVNFYGELEEIALSDPDFGELTITPAAIKGLVKGSSEAFEDSDPDLLAIVQKSLVRSMALKFDAECLIGGSTHGFAGMTKWSGTQSLDMAGKAFTDYDPFVAAVGLLAAANIPGPYVAVMNPLVHTSIARLKETHDDAESNLLLPPPDGLPSFYTSPLLTIKAASGETPATSSVLVYAPSSLACVRRKDATVEVDRSQEFDHDAVLVRGKARAALGTAYPQAVVQIKNVKTPAITL
jgi:HK97 family phage major capsid protein